MCHLLKGHLAASRNGVRSVKLQYHILLEWQSVSTKHRKLNIKQKSSMKLTNLNPFKKAAKPAHLMSKEELLACKTMPPNLAPWQLHEWSEAHPKKFTPIQPAKDPALKALDAGNVSL